MDEQELLTLVKERLIEALHLASIENVPINKLVFAYVTLKRLEIEMENPDKEDRIIVEYIDHLAQERS